MLSRNDLLLGSLSVEFLSLDSLDSDLSEFDLYCKDIPLVCPELSALPSREKNLLVGGLIDLPESWFSFLIKSLTSLVLSPVEVALVNPISDPID